MLIVPAAAIDTLIAARTHTSTIWSYTRFGMAPRTRPAAAAAACCCVVLLAASHTIGEA